MKHRSLSKDPPKVGDPVVVDGTKYRIKLVTPGAVQLHNRFGPQLTNPARPYDALYWDPLAAVWRVPA